MTGSNSGVLVGGTGIDYLEGGSGDNTLTGGAGRDVFVTAYNQNTTNTITDFNPNEIGEKIALVGFDFIEDFTSLTLTQEGSDTRINLGSEQSLLIQNVLPTSLSEQNFLILPNRAALNLYLGYYLNNATFIKSTGTDNTLPANLGALAVFSTRGNEVLVAPATNDLIDGGNGNDALSGDPVSGKIPGNDWLEGGAGNDPMNAYLGNDYLSGGSGNDVLGGGEGNDTLIGGTGRDQLKGDAGDDLLIVDGDTGKISRAINGTGLTFSAGTRAGGVGSDTFKIIVTGGGSGDYTLTPEETTFTASNVIADFDILNANEQIDISAFSWISTLTDFTITDIAMGPSNIAHLAAVNGSNSLFINIAGVFASQLSVQNFIFAVPPVTYSDRTDAINGYLIGTNANDYLIGGDSDNTLDGKAGADTMQSGTGNDRYIVDNSNDVIIEANNAGTDTVYSSVSYTLSANIENLILSGNAVRGTGNASDNLITTNIPSLYRQTSSRDGADTLDGGAGNDTLMGGWGKDTYIFGLGYGTDLIIDNDSIVGNQATVIMGPGISGGNFWGAGTTGDVTVSFTDTQVIFSLNDLDKLIFNWDVRQGAKVFDVQFDDGTWWDSGLILTLVDTAPTVSGTIEAQTIAENTAFNFTIPSGMFNDVDNEILLYEAHFPDQYALPNWLNFDSNTLQFSGTPTHADVGSVVIQVLALDRAGKYVTTEFTINVTSSNHAPTVAKALSTEMFMEHLPFLVTVPNNTFTDVDVGDRLTYTATLADGSALPSWLTFNSTTMAFRGSPMRENVGVTNISVIATDIAGDSVSTNLSITVIANSSLFFGTNNADNLTGSGYNDTLWGGSGNDSINGAVGNDILNGEAGNDSLVGSAGNDTLLGGADNDYLSDTGTSSGNNYFDGGSGNDTVVAGSGNDTYMVNRGSGHDVVTDNGGLGDTIVFGADISTSQIWIRASGQDCILSIIGTGDDITVKNCLMSSSYVIERIQASNGKALTTSALINLANAMARFAVPTLGQTTLPTSYQAVLNPIIAASWK